MMIVDQAKPLQDPASDAIVRVMADMLCQMAPRCGLEVPPAVLAFATEKTLPPEVACYALADGAGLLPHHPAILAKMPPDELTIALATMSPEQIAAAVTQMDPGQAANFVDTMGAAKVADDVLQAAKSAQPMAPGPEPAQAEALAADALPDATTQARLDLSR